MVLNRQDGVVSADREQFIPKSRACKLLLFVVVFELVVDLTIEVCSHLLHPARRRWTLMLVEQPGTLIGLRDYDGEAADKPVMPGKERAARTKPELTR